MSRRAFKAEEPVRLIGPEGKFFKSNEESNDMGLLIEAYIIVIGSVYILKRLLSYERCL